MSKPSTVGNPSSERHDHRRALDVSASVTVEIKERIRELKERLGDDPLASKRLSGFVIESDTVTDGSSPIVYYWPAFQVAGQGACLCDAYVEALEALKTQIENVAEAGDWGVLPTPDNSFGTRFAVLKTRLFLKIVAGVELLSHIPIMKDDYIEIRRNNDLMYDLPSAA